MDKIADSFKKDKLFAIRVEGHSDKRIPAPGQLDNMDLSYKRAKEVTALLEEIIDNSRLIPDLDKETIKKKIRVAGFGSNKPQFQIEIIKSEYFIVSKEDVNDKKGPFLYKEADNELLSSNRRVVINIIESSI